VVFVKKNFKSNFSNILINIMFYASALTITNLKQNKTIELAEDKCIPIDIGFSHLIKVNFEYFCITLLPVGQCAGSMMFIMEVNQYYTFPAFIRLILSH
jgi:hypothetical protein